MKAFKDLESEFKAKQEAQKEKIKSEPNKFKRFWKWVIYLFVFPWKWIFVNIRALCEGSLILKKACL